ncbi:hypothetical protein AFEL58S_01866 [Afipia felis]
MNMAFVSDQIIEISGDLAEIVKSYLTVDTTDEVLDLEIYENDLGDRCVAVALKTESWGKPVVQGAIVVVRPRPEEGASAYLVSAIAEGEGPYASFCPGRILDMLSPTDNELALDWRERCQARLLRGSLHPTFSLPASGPKNEEAARFIPKSFPMPEDNGPDDMDDFNCGHDWAEYSRPTFGL